MIRVIDHRKVEMTETEWAMYQAICEAYNQPHRKGEDLFRELFESDNDGIILFVRPPTKNFTSMEVWLFLISLMTNQHLRVMESQVHAFIREAKDNIDMLVSAAKEAISNKANKVVEPKTDS